MVCPALAFFVIVTRFAAEAKGRLIIAGLLKRFVSDFEQDIALLVVDLVVAVDKQPDRAVVQGCFEVGTPHLPQRK